MEIASLNLLKKQLASLPPEEVLKICLRIVKYKKENKELLHYLLFEAYDETSYINSIKSEIDLQFREINPRQLFNAKKSIRKILNYTNKFIRYSGQKRTEIDVLIYFCTKLKDSRLPIRTNHTFFNIYQRQLLKIAKAVATLHEDLQFDYQEEIKALLD